jgi:hypothetical protein
MAMLDPNGQDQSLPACGRCTHAGEKHRGDHNPCDVCANCTGYMPMSPDFKQTPLTLGSLQGGRKPPETPL